jgi:hypothetical protein
MLAELRVRATSFRPTSFSRPLGLGICEPQPFTNQPQACTTADRFGIEMPLKERPIKPPSIGRQAVRVRLPAYSR